jgi:hypothetical protein
MVFPTQTLQGSIRSKVWLHHRRNKGFFPSANDSLGKVPMDFNSPKFIWKSFDLKRPSWKHPFCLQNLYKVSPIYIKVLAPSAPTENNTRLSWEGQRTNIDGNSYCYTMRTDPVTEFVVAGGDLPSAGIGGLGCENEVLAAVLAVVLPSAAKEGGLGELPSDTRRGQGRRELLAPRHARRLPPEPQQPSSASSPARGGAMRGMRWSFRPVHEVGM